MSPQTSIPPSSPPTEKIHTNFNQAYVEVMQVRVGQEIILIPVSDVSEVVHQQRLTPVPMAPDHLLGVCNIHGQVVCVIDPCQVMSLPYSKQTFDDSVRFIVLSHPKMHLALRTEEILSLEPIPEETFLQATQGSQGFFYRSLNIKNQDYRILHTAALFK